MKKSMNFLEFIQIVKDENACYDLYEQWKWGDKVVSPFDSTSKVYKCKNHKYKCKNTNRYFTVKTGTCFANSKIPFTKWFYVMWLFAQGKRGISSYQVSRDIDVSQKTAWRMLHKIRKAMTGENDYYLEGEVEIDESFAGGKNANRHKDKKVERCQGRSFKDKVPVFGLIGRNGDLVAKVVSGTGSSKLLPIIRKYVEEESTIYTDGWDYGEVSEMYNQISVDHGHKYYGITYYNDNKETVMITTNTIENAWSVFKRIYATYYHISKKYMQRYVDEFVFRFNTRKLSDSDRFRLLLQYLDIGDYRYAG